MIRAASKYLAAGQSRLFIRTCQGHVLYSTASGLSVERNHLHLREGIL